MIITTKQILKRHIVYLLKELGYSDRIANVIYGSSGERIVFWSNWIKVNCSSCSKNPTDCLFFNPKVVGTLEVEEVLNYSLSSVEQGLEKCPLLTVDTKSKTNTNS